MATFSGSSPFLSHSLTRPSHFSSSSSSSSQTPPSVPPQNLPSQPHSPTPIQQLSTTSSEQPKTPVSVKAEQQKAAPSSSSTKSTKTKADSTDWIASTLTRRFGIGAGLAWAAFLTVGVVSEQIKTRLEVSQQESNTRFLIISLLLPSSSCIHTYLSISNYKI